ncbi:MAG: hypothetical protein J1F22_09850, partial [Lachnospiraceae bacterium]|nr:hypothetical protein [Lachnospiraceae bacterium]
CQFPKLFWFNCKNNKLENIYAINHEHLDTLMCDNNRLKVIDLHHVEPRLISCTNNPNVEVWLYGPESGEESYTFDKTAKIHYTD